MEIQIGEVNNLIERGLDLKLAPFVKNSQKTIGEITALFREIEGMAGEFSKKPLTVKDPQHEKIASQMRENYFVRIPKILGTIKKPEKIDFIAISDFHSETLSAMLQITKITSDNRYLIFFYKEEFGRMGGPIKELSEKADLLGGEISENAQKYQEAQAIYGMASGIGIHGAKIAELNGKIAELRIKIAKIGAELGDKKNRVNDGQDGEIEEKLGLLKSESARNGEEITHFKNRIGSLILPLERPLRKFEKISKDKKASLIARKYLRDHLIALKEEKPQLPDLMPIMDALEKMLRDGAIIEDEKDLAKHLEAILKIKGGAIGGWLNGLRQAEMMAEEIGGKIKGEQAKLDALLAKKGEASALEVELQKIQMEINDADALGVGEILMLSQKAGKFLGRDVKIVGN
ncbi:MAG: hypothetical protein AABX01_04140 [Candidatus Micrarchaeota archaeon]